MKSGKGLSPLVGVLVLIAIAVSAGVFAYTAITGQLQTAGSVAALTITEANLIKTETLTLLTVQVANTGSEPLHVAVYTDAVRSSLQALGDVTVPCCSEAKGLIIYAAVDLPPGTYTFTWGADDRANVFLNGPGLGGWTRVGPWVWGPESRSITLQGGTYEIAYVCVDYCRHGYADFRANLPVNQIRWLVTAYHARWPEGDCWSPPWKSQLDEFFSSVEDDPIHPGNWHPGTYTITGQYTCTTGGSFDFNTDWRDGNPHNDSPTNQPANLLTSIPIGLLEPGVGGGFTVPLDPGYAGNPNVEAGRTYLVTAAGFKPDGSLAFTTSKTVTATS